MAGFIQGLTSFGFALVSMPLLTLWLPLQETVPLVVMLSVITNIAILAGAYKDAAVRKIWVLVLSSIAAAPLGAWLLLVVDASVLKVATGLLVLAYSALLLTGKSFPVRNERFAFVPVGIASGLLNGSISMSGPPVALFLSGQGTGKAAFRANLTAYAAILNIITIVSFSQGGLLNGNVMSVFGWTVPVLLAGVWLGIKAVRRLNRFSVAVLHL
ncbi:sulfite exporter TauE/SafE family protein [Paenibacillus sp. 7124]|uniref:Probable membrane transporter protein n=2 Tax=Paenibacillus apii TaxID=1850370 RepID=A0A6M1PQ99_9BACL|nr:sulfite exporter TauE/SafE family protein [Paenibacillus apii]NJJ38223.1 sulfite exporter TauE/SafE family protein [Paenibacillus apii]